MKRFDRLEFDDAEARGEGKDAAQISAEAEALHDEHHWLKCADTERREGFFENALRYYSRSLEVNKAMVAGWVGQVQMLIALGEFSEAELWSRKALELFKNHGDLIAGRAHALVRMGDAGSALPLSDNAFKQEGMSAYRWMVRGEIMLARQQDVDEHCFTKAAQLDGDWLTLVEIAQICRFWRKPARGLAYARRAVDRSPEKFFCWYVQGCCEVEAGMINAGRKSLGRCMEIKPGNLDAMRQINELDGKGWQLGARLKNFFRLKR